MTFDFDEATFRRLGHELVELMIELTRAERADPVLARTTGNALRALIDEPLPQSGCAPEDVLAMVRDTIAPFCRRHGHPRFFGYVCTSADPVGVLADGLASALNQTVTAWRSTPGAVELERLVLRWLDTLVRFNGSGGGLMVSGGSLANLHGIACAVTCAEERARLGSGSRHELTAYVTQEGHVSLRKAARLLGFRDEHVRFVATDAHRRARLDDLRSHLDRDMAAGLVPAVVCASAGTANTGTIDPLDGMADICAERGVWLHIDGSYGAPAVLTDAYRWMAPAFGRADSLSLDPHKWLFAPVDAGCILVRDEAVLHRTFAWFSEYTAVSQTDPIERHAFFDHGIEMSRRFRALKVWAILKTRGVNALRSTIDRDIALRSYLDERVAAEPRLEGLGSELSISCFRYVPEGASTEPDLARVNQAILDDIVTAGSCYMSPTTLDGRYALRVCIVNFRTTSADIDVLVDAVLRAGDRHARAR